MKAFIMNMATYTLISGGIIASEFYGLEYAGNVAMFVAWCIVGLGFIALAGDPEVLAAGNTKFKWLCRSATILTILAMAAAGWLVTALFYASIVFLLQTKVETWRNEHKT